MYIYICIYVYLEREIYICIYITSPATYLDSPLCVRAGNKQMLRAATRLKGCSTAHGLVVPGATPLGDGSEPCAQ